MNLPDILLVWLWRHHPRLDSQAVLMNRDLNIYRTAAYGRVPNAVAIESKSSMIRTFIYADKVDVWRYGQEAPTSHKLVPADPNYFKKLSLLIEDHYLAVQA